MLYKIFGIYIIVMSSSYRKKTSKKRLTKYNNKIRKNKYRTVKKNKGYLKKLLLDEEISRNIIKESARKTPVVAMGHGVKLLSKSKKHLKKGNIGNAMASLLTAVAVLSATGPFQQHPNTKTQRMTREYEGRWTGDPDELMKWHMEEQFEPSLKKTTRRKGKTLKKTQGKPIKRRSKTKKNR